VLFQLESKVGDKGRDRRVKGLKLERERRQKRGSEGERGRVKE
jgi:hypothetical protein